MDWMLEGSCVDEPAELFFPDTGIGVDAARRICAGCPIQERCLEYALDNHIVHGVWGGCSERERKRIRRRRKLGQSDGPRARPPGRPRKFEVWDPVADAPVADARAPEFDAFQDLARKLVNVPKAEIDEERAKYEASRPPRGMPKRLVRAALDELGDRAFTVADIAKMVPDVSKGRIFDLLCELDAAEKLIERIPVPRPGRKPIVWRARWTAPATEIAG